MTADESSAGDLAIQQNALDRIAHALGEGRLCILLGAGVSIQATEDPAKAWSGVIESALAHCAPHPGQSSDWAGRVLADAKERHLPTMLAAADKITGSLDEQQMLAWMQKIASWRVTDTRLLDELSRIAQERRDILWMTTNYDRLATNHLRYSTVTWRDSASVKALLAGHLDGAMLHLHGSCDRQETIIFGGISYENLRHSSLEEVLRAVFLTKVVVAVGVGDGLADPNFSSLTRWLGGAFKDASTRFLLFDPSRGEVPDGGGTMTPVPVRHEELASFFAQVDGTDVRPGHGHPARKDGVAALTRRLYGMREGLAGIQADPRLEEFVALFGTVLDETLAELGDMPEPRREALVTAGRLVRAFEAALNPPRSTRADLV